LKSVVQKIPLENTSVELFIKREDLIHPFVSGNKFRKLKYNLLEAKNQKKTVLLTFGGAFSNHIAATAFAGKENGFKTMGIIRGDELNEKIDQNPTLKFAKECGMQLEFVSRENYRLKDSEDYIDKLREQFGDFYLIPEGGTNSLAVKGCEEILNDEDILYDYVCVAVGTGGTISGIINNSASHQKILGFPALKGDFLQKDICKFATKEYWDLISDYHFGGYAKVSAELIAFLNSFHEKYQIPLDPIYTGKLVFGVIDKINAGYFPENSKIVVIHTGGIQGIEGMNIKLKSKKLPILNYHD
jgi:1-aminocyclopropane-1-carboxylate deaminase